jgi:tRNA threonylcarbamoyladenosine biosynthesis protein TsaB
MLRSEMPTGYGEMLPRYMRETEAEQKLKDGTLAKLREAKMAKFRSK